jgi:hypothetical protein
MANYWAIAIGINQYQFLQPLMYAQWDAYCLHHCFQHDAGFLDEHCWLLTDTSVPIQGQDTRPTRENIQHHIVQLCQHQLAADDVLWLFFSGYGVHANGRDYLMPLDGDPSQPVATGIPISELFATLKTAATSNLVVLLDMKQFGGTGSSSAQLGHHTLAVAQEHDLAVILSCQPGQFSHETLALRQGLFTAVLLEGIQQHGCMTLEHLAQYMGDRLPTLSEQHWRPKQNPAIFIPAALRYQLMLPGKDIPVGQNAILDRQPSLADDSVDSAWNEPSQQQPSQPSTAFLEAPSNYSTAHAPSTSASISHPSSATAQPSQAGAHAPVGAGTLASQHDIASQHENDDGTFWANVLKWGGLVVVLLITGVVWRNWSVFHRDRQPNPLGAPTEDVRGNDSSSQQVSPSESGSSGQPNLASASAIDPPILLEGDSVSTTAALDTAQQAIAAGLPLEALEWLDRIPASDHTDAYTELRADAEQLNAQLNQTNQAILNEAIASLNRAREETPVNQASDFHRAIEQAQRIQPGQPVYREAQEYVERWSEVILDLAEARAQTGDYADAIAAAQLIPRDQTQLQPIIEQRIERWQQNLNQGSATQDAILQASTLVRPGQASSYNDAIAQLRTIEATQPEYETVRNQLNEWSREILAIAYQRAEDGNLYEAIEAGALVPDDAEVALEARAAIENWRLQLRGN